MRKMIVATLLTALCAANMSASLPGYVKVGAKDTPVTAFGKIERYKVKSESLNDSIIVDILTPKGYEHNGETYPVLYAFDGQNLFDPVFSFAGVAWELDSLADCLAQSGEICSPIIVGINNRGSKNLRPNDYFPEKTLEYIATEDRAKTYVYETCQAGFNGDEHTAFVAEELKPLVDHLYRTKSDREHTMTMGSSMGALAALYIMCEYPETFGAAACMSTHWIGSLKLGPNYSMTDDPVCARAVLEYFDNHLPDASQHRLHMDMGDLGWDASYIAYEKQARDIAAAHGYTQDKGNLQTAWFGNSGHNEWFWQQHASMPLTFLLKDNQAGVKDITDSRDIESDAYYFSLSGLKFKAHDASSLPSGIYIHNGAKVFIKGSN